MSEPLEENEVFSEYLCVFHTDHIQQKNLSSFLPLIVASLAGVFISIREVGFRSITKISVYARDKCLKTKIAMNFVLFLKQELMKLASKAS